MITLIRLHIPFRSCYFLVVGIQFNTKRKITPKFHTTENLHHHLRNFISSMTLKGFNRDIFHLVFLGTFNKDAMR